MATIAEMQTALDDLIKSDGELSIPGLEFNSVVDNMVEVQFKESLAAIPDATERQNYKATFLEYYKTTGRQEIQNKISEIKMNYSAAVANLESLSNAMVSAVASNAIPSVLTVGSATSAPNPVYALIENKTKKNTLLGLCKTIETFLFNILKAAISIMFEVPSAVMVLISMLLLAKQTIKAIPV